VSNKVAEAFIFSPPAFPILYSASQLLLECTRLHRRPRGLFMSDMREAIGVLLAGGQGERLWPLTRDRAKPRSLLAGSTASLTSRFQLHQLQLTPRLRSHAVQSPELEPSHPRRMVSLAGLGEYIEVLPRKCVFRSSGIKAPPTPFIRTFIPSAASVPNMFSFYPATTFNKMDYSRMLKQHVDSGADVNVRRFKSRCRRPPASSE